MKTFSLYKHEQFRDVAMMPVKIFKVPKQDRYKLKVRWFNVHYNEIGCREPFDITHGGSMSGHSIELTKEQVQKFKLYVPEEHWNTYKR